ncbi:MAG: 2Fe-2S iron-sulfur cluster binding domain-containing protein [Proteobacteria bacterium]|nr:2Fe-2S iron-sulfur cluster binding domain-containing protein [Pseudomonadota bacterium]
MKQDRVLRLVVNGTEYEAETYPGESLLHLLREKLGFTDVKEGCGKGDCGTCTVIMDGKAVNACIVFALQAEGREIVTVRGLGSKGRLHPIQTAFMEYGAIQCGFCIPGMILSAKALLDENPHPTREEIKVGISGNLCRCTGYQKIVDAIEAVSREKGKI